ncbi:HesA/MoeB/ThiF family protein [Mucilaginibacter gotjawali]|uniref:Molybdopterin-synthase adenylyltransferase n=2 Tax=Mucilaginibacter gotjawali TaxID=1550579 RepID=A0A110B2P3_9SPHI|nr:HesA/MoeB/ThiF family protein [Mucilaginibacter gotjawali]MBB3053896.1 adenylyltransferase/sulfurtransferase [Mucilaginibacter gotjawali]BAU54160.1 putative adenylyltransferase/sulfurtransferase MoeZ [Mucilaginibacter gotjawali]
MELEFLRYSCQIALPGFSEATQLRLQHARVLVVGAGGLGCPAAQYLAASGIGTLGIADFDVVSVSNLHRQILFAPADAGKKKAPLACERLQAQNPGITVIAHDMRVTSQNVMELVSQYDVIVDGTDNFDTRYLLNDAGVLAGKPVVYGAIYQFEGQVAVWNIKNQKGTRSPNYRDLFPEVDSTQIPNCAEGGVIPTLAGIIGCMQANEVIKYITETGELLAGKVLIFDAQTMQSRIIKIGEVTHTAINRLKETIFIPTVSVDELKSQIAAKSVRLVDVRTERERDEFDIGGEHIPLDELDGYIDGGDETVNTVFYCGTGKRSGEAVKDIMKKYPGARVFSLDGGLKAWIEQWD